jgi:hypothetical protein
MAIIGDAGIDRIIAAVGVESIYPIDRDGLKGCLDLAFRRYCDAVQLSSDVADRAEIRQLSQIRVIAKRLELLLGRHVDLRQWAMIGNGSSSPGDVPSTHQGPFTTTDLVAAIDDRLKKRYKPDERYARSFKKYNPFDWIAGVYLPDVYEFNFRTAPTISENGPFVRFAEAVLRELKIIRGMGQLTSAHRF